MGRGGEGGGWDEGHEKKKKKKKKTSPNGVGDKIFFMIPLGRGVIDMISFSGFKMIWLLGDASPNPPYFILKCAFSSENELAYPPLPSLLDQRIH